MPFKFSLEHRLRTIVLQSSLDWVRFWFSCLSAHFGVPSSRLFLVYLIFSFLGDSMSRLDWLDHHFPLKCAPTISIFSVLSVCCLTYYYTLKAKYLRSNLVKRSCGFTWKVLICSLWRCCWNSRFYSSWQRLS